MAATANSTKKGPEQAWKELEKVFNRFDSNGDGKISASELAGVLAALGRSEPSEEDVGRMMAEIDSDGDGFIDLKEFREFQSGMDGGDRDLKDAFEMYDLDKNGLISAKELHKVLGKLGEACTVEECCRMIKSVDSDGDGSVNFQEFKKMMTNGISSSSSPSS